MSTILMAGIDHSKAGIDERSLFSFTKKGMTEAYEYIRQVKNLEGCVILSTCNRMELWMCMRGDTVPEPVDLLCAIKGKDPQQYRHLFTIRSGREACEHLFRLSCGLKSRILGEDQIITQVKDALSFAREQYMAGHVLEVLFRLAVTAGKKVKTEVTLSTASQSVIHQAVAVLKQDGYRFEGKKCMVIGNGAMGKLTASTLKEEGVDVTVTVRQYRSGMVEIPEGCKRINYGERLELLPKCDLVVSATSSPNYTLTRAELEPLSIDHPIMLIDLAVPRDIETEAGDLEYLTVYDIDHFQVDIRNEQVQANIAMAEQILMEQMAEFYAWYEGRDVVPRIQKVKEAAATDLDLRITRIVKSLELEEKKEEEFSQQLHGAAERMLNKMLFELKAGVTDDTFRECLAALEQIYRKETDI